MSNSARVETRASSVSESIAGAMTASTPLQIEHSAKQKAKSANEMLEASQYERDHLKLQSCN